jgi:serine/threonine protein kinase
MRHPPPSFTSHAPPDSGKKVLELVDGGELFDRISERAVYSERDARVLIATLLDVLAHMEARHIVHRDVRVCRAPQEKISKCTVATENKILKGGVTSMETESKENRRSLQR